MSPERSCARGDELPGDVLKRSAWSSGWRQRHGKDWKMREVNHLDATYQATGLGAIGGGGSTEPSFQEQMGFKERGGFRIGSSEAAQDASVLVQNAKTNKM